MNYKYTLYIILTLIVSTSALAVSPVITAPQNNGYINGTYSITWTGNENPWTIEYYIGGSWSNICPSTSNLYCSWDTTAIVDALYTVRVTDTNTHTDSVNVTIDNTPPTEPTVTTPGIIVGETYQINWSATTEANFVRYELYYNNSTGSWINIYNETNIATTTYDWDVPSLLNYATANLKVIATDEVGKTNESVSGQFIIDTTDPTITNVQTDKNYYKNGENINVTWTVATDTNIADNVTIEYFDGAVWNMQADFNTANDGEFVFSAPNLNNDSVQVRVTAFDNATPRNNATAQSSTFIIDNEAPVISGLVPSNNTILGDPAVSLSWNVIDSIDTVPTCNLTVDGSINQSNTETYSKSITVSQGLHNWSVLCWDNATNSDNSGTYFFTVDTNIPVVSLVSPTNNTWETTNTSSFDYGVTSLGTATTYTCNLTLDGSQVDSNSSVPHNSSSSFFGQERSDGTHYWNVSCSRNDNGLTGYSVTYINNVDVVTPVYSITSPTNVNGNFDVDYTITEATSGFNLSNNCSVYDKVNAGATTLWRNITSGGTQSGTFTYDSSGLSDGDVINFYMNCTDVAGNIGTTVTDTTNYDTSVPNTYSVSLNKYDVWTNESVDVTALVTSSNTLSHVTANISGYLFNLTDQGNNVWKTTIDLSTVSIQSSNETIMKVIATDIFSNVEPDDTENTVTFTLRTTEGESYINQNAMIALIEEFFQGVRDAAGNLYLKASEIAALYYNKTTTDNMLATKVNISSSFGGEVSGNYSNIVLDNNALDDQYVELLDAFGGDVSGTYDNLQLGSDSVGANELSNTAIQSGDIDTGDLPSGATLDTEWDTQGEVETIWGVTLATDSELTTETNNRVSNDSALDVRISSLEATDPLDYDNITDLPAGVTLDTEWDTQGEIETVIGTTLATDTELSNETVNRIADVDAEEARAIAAENALDTRVNTLEFDLINKTYVDSQDALKYDKTGGTINGDVTVNGDLTVIGSLINASVSNQIMNGSFLPTTTDLFNIGSGTKVWANVYATRLYGSITESQITDLTHFTNADETDQVFTAWDKSTGISITESQITDLNHFTNANETDQIWTGEKGNYYNKTEVDVKFNTIGGNIEKENDGIKTRLVKGWNDFRLPSYIMVGTNQTSALNLTGNYSVENVLSSIMGNFDYLSYYDGTDWKVYVPTEAVNDFTEFPTAANTPDYVYHIHMNATDDLEINTI